MYTSNPEVSTESSAVLQRFRELLPEISMTLISVDLHDIDDEIDRCLELTQEFWGFDSKNSFLLEQLCHGEIVALERSGIGESGLYPADGIGLPAGYPLDIEIKKDHL